jgi:hypothetical protein
VTTTLPRIARLVRVYAASTATTAVLLSRRQLTHPPTHVGRTLAFADGTRSEVYRETVRLGSVTADPTVVVIQFRLRLIGLDPRLHGAFRVESMANTPLFAGFPGFRTKLWLTDLETGVYRGVYDWDGVDPARRYADAMCRLLSTCSGPGTVRAHIEPDTGRDDFLRAPASERAGHAEGDGWWMPQPGRAA